VGENVRLGDPLGNDVGTCDGEIDGFLLGRGDGPSVGAELGKLVGVSEGYSEGDVDGFILGRNDGS